MVLKAYPPLDRYIKRTESVKQTEMLVKQTQMLNGSVKQTVQTVKQNYFTSTMLNKSVKQTFHPLNKQRNPLNKIKFVKQAF